MAVLSLLDVSRRTLGVGTSSGKGAMSEKPRKHKFIKSAIRHPGREKERAKEHGISTHEQMERDSHSPDKSLAAAGRLGLRLTGGDLSPHKKSKSARRYSTATVTRG